MSERLSAALPFGATGLPQNFVMSAGDYRRLKVTVFDERQKPVVLRKPRAVTWTLARTARSPAATIIKTLENGVEVIHEDAGQGQDNCGRFDIILTERDTMLLDGEYVQNCRVTNEDGETFSVFSGRVNIAPCQISKGNMT